MDVVGGMQHLGVPRLLCDIGGAVCGHHIVGQCGDLRLCGCRDAKAYCQYPEPSGHIVSRAFDL